MMEIVLICISAVIASFLTFFSGFGLGTILTPVFAIFYGVEAAVLLTAVVHLLNNLFKLVLVYRSVDWKLVLKFGIPSMLAALLGAWLLDYMSVFKKEIFTYVLGGHAFTIDTVRLALGLLIILFAFFELSKKLSSLTFKEGWLVPGALLSGFFGGFSGHQGALRSAFLLRLNLEKQVFIATGVTIACVVDLARIPLYLRYDIAHVQNNWQLLLLAVISAWAGALIGNKIFKKTSMEFFKWFVGIFMLVMGALIAGGIVK